jgi:prepilin-type N-terminal cleavage/methylation domain-containing protein
LQFSLSRRDQCRGVSMLEMLVALTILALSATLLFDWVYQVNTRMRKLNEQQAQAFAKIRAVEFLGLVNPALTPTGQQPFTQFILEWQAKPATAMRATLDANDAPLRVELAVFDVHARLLQPGSKQVWLEFDTRLPGWNRLAQGNLSGIAGLISTP